MIYCQKNSGEKIQRFEKKLENFLKEIPDVAITTDNWKNKRLTFFLCITAHYFDRLQLLFIDSYL